MSRTLAVGQRWISESEPELGLGLVISVEGRHVDLHFPATDGRRRYAVATAPLRRAIFQPGDLVRGVGQESFRVDRLEDDGSLLRYHGAGASLLESELAGELALDAPEDRLAAGDVDPAKLFSLRRVALEARLRWQASPLRGLVGARMALLPHQLFIADEVSRRIAPRVLLADEVGLGKTIEAGLIVHRMLLTGRAERVLILVPESLVHQWLVELLRRFHLHFRVFDEPRCASIETGDAAANPFLTEQLVLSSIGWLANDHTRSAQACAAGFDCIVVDEAHHLEWSQTSASAEYALVEALAGTDRGLLLLTATPEQLGPEGHFARLRLLDPARHHDIEAHRTEAANLGATAAIVERLLSGEKLTEAQLQRLGFAPDRASQKTTSDLLAELIDCHGTGRVLFRNTRPALPTPFPRRIAHLHRLGSAAAERGFEARLVWLACLLQRLGEEKIVLIAQSPAVVEAIASELPGHRTVKSALFHQDMTLLQRDRAAAWFVAPDGARLLLCSEIGSEGRNFQSAQHLVLFDLPQNFDLLEQRIGRLDRIGQTGDIHIHLPWLANSEEEVWARWVHEGVNALERTLHGSAEIYGRFSARVRELARDWAAQNSAAGPLGERLAALVSDSRVACRELTLRLERGRDRLLELSSYRGERAEGLVQSVVEIDHDPTLEQLMISIWDYFGVEIDDLAARTYRLLPEHLTIDAFPGIPEDGVTVTFDRRLALEREDFAFLSWDHPMVSGALDLVLTSRTGNCALTHLSAPGIGNLPFALEVILVIETLAPPALGANRFLPASPVRIVLDTAGEDRTSSLPPAALDSTSREHKVDAGVLREPQVGVRLRELVARARSLAEAQRRATAAMSLAHMHAALDPEIDRLVALQRVNSSVRPAEIEGLHRQVTALTPILAEPRLRLDMIRLALRPTA